MKNENELFRTADTDLAAYLIEIKGRKLSAPYPPPLQRITDHCNKQKVEFCFVDATSDDVACFRAHSDVQRFIHGRRALLRMIHQEFDLMHVCSPKNGNGKKKNAN